MERVLLVARLRNGARERAEQLLTDEGRADAPEDAFDRGAIYLSDTEVVFLFEGDGAAEAARAILDDPVKSTVITPWLPLFDGPLHRVREAYSWETSTKACAEPTALLTTEASLAMPPGGRACFARAPGLTASLDDLRIPERRFASLLRLATMGRGFQGAEERALNT